MASIRIAKPGYNALTDGVEHMVIDSNYRTQLIASSGNGSINVPASATFATTALNLGSDIGFMPYQIFLTTSPSTGIPVRSGAYQFAPTTQPGTVAEGLIPGRPPQYLYVEQSSAYTADYMYYVTYLPIQGSLSSAANNTYTAPYVNVALPGGNANTDSLQNLAWSSEVQTLHVISSQSYTVNANMAPSGTPSEFAFTHGLGYPTVFNGIIKGFSGGNMNFNTAANYQEGSVAMGFAIDATNFYFYFLNSGLSNVSINYTLVVHYFIQP